MIIGDIVCQDSAQVALAEDDHVVQAFAPDGSESAPRRRDLETFKFSTDPNAEAKIYDVVGLYLRPPAGAACRSTHTPNDSSFSGLTSGAQPRAAHPPCDSALGARRSAAQIQRSACGQRDER